MPRIAILSDTHVPSRASEIPDWVEDELRSADHVIHAGDFDSSDTFAAIQQLSDGELTAAAGNMDPRSLDLPEVASVTLGGRTFVVYHGTGSPRGYRRRVKERVAEASPVEDPIAISGHTHEVLDVTEEGLRILNPGSATGASPATEASIMCATVEDGSLTIDVLRG